MWEEIIQTDGLFGQLRFWHSVDFITAQKVENILVSWVVAETSGQVSAFSPGDQTLTTGAIEELESVVESLKFIFTTKKLLIDEIRARNWPSFIKFEAI